MAVDSEFTQLVKRARQGDKEATGRIYTEYAMHVKRCVRYRLRKLRLQNSTTADDVFDSVFRQLLKPGALDKFDDTEHLCNYLEKAVHRKATEYLRRMTKGDQEDLAQPTAADEAEDKSSEELLNDLEQREELDRIYSRLMPHERLLCTLRRGGYLWDEIAARLNTTPTAARQAFHRAMARVKRFAQNSAGPRRKPK
ncbi:MAG: sigma-70 family RNA polymerase sigma factor [Planctomycetota bacterium]|nr:sigma-70 family RNA polymerase sigma factor [Planctomycetota bacterium]